MSASRDYHRPWLQVRSQDRWLRWHTAIKGLEPTGSFRRPEGLKADGLLSARSCNRNIASDQSGMNCAGLAKPDVR